MCRQERPYENITILTDICSRQSGRRLSYHGRGVPCHIKNESVLPGLPAKRFYCFMWSIRQLLAAF
jgi:alpha-D-ribose 1-methylphosphonate 5-triphosphate synthase subunit PhnH